MKIEHTAYAVVSPGEMGQWYVDHLGFSIKRGADAPIPVRFLADGTGEVMLEVYNNPQVAVPDYRSMDPLVLHLAFCSDDVPADAERLMAAGAELLSGPEVSPTGDHLAMLRDPWGLAIQLCKRAEPMVSAL